MDYKYHEAANIFPLMPTEQLQTLAQDIRENGLKLPVELCDGKIIDGRNRLKACEIAGVEPDFVEVNPKDPVCYVVSLNLHRRHLNETQRANAAAKALPFYEAKAKERQKAGGGDKKSGAVNLPQPIPHATRARDEVGSLFKVSGKSVSDAKKVNENGSPALKKAVADGEIAVSTAAKLTKLPKAEQTAKVKEGKQAVQETAKEISKPVPPRYPASDLVALNLGNFIGMFVCIEQRYGSFVEAVKHKDWDRRETQSIFQQLSGVEKSIRKLNKEIRENVSE